MSEPTPPASKSPADAKNLRTRLRAQAMRTAEALIRRVEETAEPDERDAERLKAADELGQLTGRVVSAQVAFGELRVVEGG